MLKLCKNHSKSFKVPFGGEQERKKERENGVIFFFSFASAPSFPLSLAFLSPFLSVSSRLNHHSLSFHSIPFRLSPRPPPPLPPRSFFDSFPPFQPLSLSLSFSLTLCIFFYCFPLNYGNQLKLRGLLLKALEFDYYNHIYKGW